MSQREDRSSPLMELCKFDVPLLKRVPTDEASHFATVWGRLLDEAVYSGSEVAWSEFFLFPKVILWAPPRGGHRLAKKASHLESRLRRWPAECCGWRLWRELTNDLWSLYRNPSQGGQRLLLLQLCASET